MREQRDISQEDLVDFGGDMRKHFDESLNMLNDNIIQMAELVSVAIRDSVVALRDKNVELAHKVVVGDEEINAKEKEIESMALAILLKEQPMASDLRFVTSALKLITDLERIGDQASDIAYLNIKLTKRNYKLEQLGSVTEMTKITVTMVNDAIKAYVTGDADLAVDVVERDKEVNELFAKVRREVVEDFKDETFKTKNTLDIFMIAKYLERIGDHAENIGRRVYFSLKGQHLEKE